MKRYFEEEEWIMFAAWKTKKWINLEDIFCVHEAIKMKISSLFVTYVHVWKKNNRICSPVENIHLKEK